MAVVSIITALFPYPNSVKQKQPVISKVSIRSKMCLCLSVCNATILPPIVIKMSTEKVVMDGEFCCCASVDHA